jgi:hypothetical protein
MGEIKPSKNSLNHIGEFSNNEHWQNSYGTLFDKYLEIVAIIGDIIFFMALLIPFTSSERENAILGALLKK